MLEEQKDRFRRPKGDEIQSENGNGEAIYVVTILLDIMYL